MNNDNLINALSRQHHLTAVAPTSSNKFVEELLDELGLDATPMRVPFQNETYSKEVSCYFNVEEKIKHDGGGIVYGWAIWQSDYLCEAEHHAVWHDATGKLLDITPKPRHFDNITFVIDNDRPYKGITIGNVRINTTGSSLIDDYILAKSVLEWTSRYEKRTDILRFTLPLIVLEYVGDDKKPGPIKQIESNILMYYLLGNNEYNNCYCGSEKQYKDCHRKINEHLLALYVNNIIRQCGEAPEIK